MIEQTTLKMKRKMNSFKYICNYQGDTHRYTRLKNQPMGLIYMNQSVNTLVQIINNYESRSVIQKSTPRMNQLIESEETKQKLNLEFQEADVKQMLSIKNKDSDKALDIIKIQVQRRKNQIRKRSKCMLWIEPLTIEICYCNKKMTNKTKNNG